MNNSSNKTTPGDSSFITGVSLIPLSIVGLILNTIVFIAIQKNPTLTRTFYVYTLNYLVSDCLGLSSEGLYTGLSAALGTIFNEYIEQIMALVSLVAWFTKSGFLVLLSATRCYILSKNQIGDNFGRPLYVHGSCFFLWIFFTLFYSSYFFDHTKFVYMDVRTAGWRLSRGTQSQWIKINISIYNMSALFVVVMVILINCATLIIVRKKLSRRIFTQSHNSHSLTSNNLPAQERNRRRETKLFVQCFVTSALYAFGISVALLFGATSELAAMIIRYWQIVVYVECAIISLIMNREVKNTVKKWFIK